jgi:hypothetical protein
MLLVADAGAQLGDTDAPASIRHPLATSMRRASKYAAVLAGDLDAARMLV